LPSRQAIVPTMPTIKYCVECEQDHSPGL
jgi:hypothetical protein